MQPVLLALFGVWLGWEAPKGNTGVMEVGRDLLKYSFAAAEAGAWPLLLLGDLRA